MSFLSLQLNPCFVRNTKADTYDYGNIAFGEGKIAKFLRVSFEFSDSTLNRLIESIGYMKMQDGESETSSEGIMDRRDLEVVKVPGENELSRT